MRFISSLMAKAANDARGPVLALSVLFGCLLSGGAVAQTLPERVEKPAFKVGDYWVRNRLDGMNGKLLGVVVNTLTVADKAGYRMSSVEGFGGLGTTIVLNGDFNMLRTEAEGYLHTTKPVYPSHVFPLYIGKTWKQQVEMAWSTVPDVSMVIDMESKVVGWEMVTVPAGNFMALKIESGGWYNGKKLGAAWTGKIKETIWFAPDARNVVRQEYHEKIAGKSYRHEITELQNYGLMR